METGRFTKHEWPATFEWSKAMNKIALNDFQFTVVLPCSIQLADLRMKDYWRVHGQQNWKLLLARTWHRVTSTSVLGRYLIFRSNYSWNEDNTRQYEHKFITDFKFQNKTTTTKCPKQQIVVADRNLHEHNSHFQHGFPIFFSSMVRWDELKPSTTGLRLFCPFWVD